MRELGPHGQAYREEFEGWQELEAMRLQAPGQAETLNDAFEHAVLVMEVLEQGATTDFREALTTSPDEATERRRRHILDLRNHPHYPDVISEEDVQRHLAALPDSEKDKHVASAFFVGQLMNADWFKLGLIKAGSSLAEMPPDSPADTPELGTRQPLPVKVYGGDNVLMLNEKEAVPLSRRANQTQYTVEEEKFIEAARLRTLQFLADHPDETFYAPAIWEAIMPPGIPFNSSHWYSYIGNFLAEELVFEGKPLVRVWKVTPSARRRHYQLGEFAPSFEFSDEASGTTQLTIFKLLNGEVMGGREGRLANLLLQANADSPVIRETLISEGVCTLDEINSRKYGEHILSSSVATVRKRLRDAGLDHLYVIHKVTADERRSPTSHRRKPGYWMELIDAAELESIQQIHQAHVAAKYVFAHNDLLQEMGLAPLPEEAVKRLAEADIVAQGEASEQAAGGSFGAYQSFRKLVEEKTERLMELPSDDPRWPLIDHLDLMLRDPTEREVFDDVMEPPLESQATEQPIPDESGDSNGSGSQRAIPTADIATIGSDNRPDTADPATPLPVAESEDGTTPQETNAADAPATTDVDGAPRNHGHKKGSRSRPWKRGPRR